MFLLKAVEADQESASVAHLLLGDLMREVGDRASALQEYKEASKVDSQYGWAHYRMASLFEETAEFAASKSSYEAAAKANPLLYETAVQPRLRELKAVEMADQVLEKECMHFVEQLGLPPSWMNIAYDKVCVSHSLPHTHTLSLFHSLFLSSFSSSLSACLN